MNGCVRDPYQVPWGTRGPLQDRLGVPDSAVTEDRRERTLERLLGRKRTELAAVRRDTDIS